jgi:hypothetical protein
MVRMAVSESRDAERGETVVGRTRVRSGVIGSCWSRETPRWRDRRRVVSSTLGCNRLVLESGDAEVPRPSSGELVCARV